MKKFQMFGVSFPAAACLLLLAAAVMLHVPRVGAFSSPSSFPSSARRLHAPLFLLPAHHHSQHQHHHPTSAATRTPSWVLASSTTTTSSDVDIVDKDDMEEAADALVTAKGLLKRDRYIVMNRFAVRAAKAGKMEQRWATRKSRLSTLPGFRYFHLMRRVKKNEDDIQKQYYYDEGDSDESAQENYVSFTIWERKSDFSAWRKGDAFKEAHGGTSIGAFLSTMVNSALILRGPPRPAFYDGLLVQSVPQEEIPKTVDGWRQVEADGIETLPAECFVELTKYHVASDQAKAFEEFWQKEEEEKKAKIKSLDGLVVSSILRRDGQASDNSKKGLHGLGSRNKKNDEPSYVRIAIFKNQESAAAAAPSPPKQLCYQDPVTCYYEGTLVIANSQGA